MLRTTIRGCVYEPSPMPVVQQMLDMAGVTARDTLYDLGCGDGRIVIAAAQRGARAVGVDYNPARIDECRDNAEAAGVSDSVQFVRANIFGVDVREATVVTLFLLREINEHLRPRLLAQLSPGARVVSHYHDMQDWEPHQIGFAGDRPVYLWVIGLRVTP